MMTLVAARQWLVAFYKASDADETQPCEHGHLHCSALMGGPCMDEILSSFPELDPDNNSGSTNA